MDQTRLAATLAAHEHVEERLIEFYLLSAPILVGAQGQLTEDDRETVIALSARLRPWGLPPYVLLHGRDPAEVSVMSAMRSRGSTTATGALAEPLPLPARIVCSWDLNTHLESIHGHGDPECEQVRSIVIGSLESAPSDAKASAILTISTLPAQFMVALDIELEGLEWNPKRPLTVTRLQLDRDGRARTSMHLGRLT